MNVNQTHITGMGHVYPQGGNGDNEGEGGPKNSVVKPYILRLEAKEYARREQLERLRGRKAYESVQNKKQCPKCFSCQTWVDCFVLLFFTSHHLWYKNNIYTVLFLPFRFILFYSWDEIVEKRKKCVNCNVEYKPLKVCSKYIRAPSIIYKLLCNRILNKNSLLFHMQYIFL